MAEDDPLYEAIDRVKALLNEDRVDEAEMVLNGVERQFPVSPEVCLNRAFVDWARDDLAAARESAKRAVELQPDDMTLHFRVASLLFGLGDLDGARERMRELKQAVHDERIGPDFVFLADMMHLAGLIHWEKGDLEKAEKALTLAFKASPETRDHGYRLAHFYDEQGRLDESLSVLERTQEKCPDDERVPKLIRDTKHALNRQRDGFS